ncbi:MAG TPA: GNAT family N-acetyltransferase [Ktedonosporobacter sp.]|nr:GNAT family N-acetyltransferase [Ktedonosporobacter sp.]
MQEAAAQKNEVSIRAVRMEDAEDLLRIAGQEGVIENIIFLPSYRLEQRRASLSELGPNDHYFVAEIQGKVVGIVGLTVGTGRRRHSGDLFIYVDRDYHGKGIGSKLLRTALDLADNWLLLRRIELTVLKDNEGAKRLYERLGFEVEGLRKLAIISKGEIKDEWLMARYRN